MNYISASPFNSVYKETITYKSNNFVNTKKQCLFKVSLAFFLL